MAQKRRKSPGTESHLNLGAMTPAAMIVAVVYTNDEASHSCVVRTYRANARVPKVKGRHVYADKSSRPAVSMLHRLRQPFYALRHPPRAALRPSPQPRRNTVLPGCRSQIMWGGTPPGGIGATKSGPTTLCVGEESRCHTGLLCCLDCAKDIADTIITVTG